MSKDKYPSISSPQMEAVVINILQIFFTTRAVQKIVGHLTKRFHVSVRMFSNRSQMTSKCGKNKKWRIRRQPSVSLMLSPHFDVFSGLLLQHGIYLFYIIKKQTATQKTFLISKCFNITRKCAFAQFGEDEKKPFDETYYLYKMKQFY